jgi:septum formation inhibitor-activating ATPase MinD
MSKYDIIRSLTIQRDETLLLCDRYKGLVDKAYKRVELGERYRAVLMSALPIIAKSGDMALLKETVSVLELSLINLVLEDKSQPVQKPCVESPPNSAIDG